MKKKLSIIVPCYNEEEVLPYFYEQICAIAEKMDFVDFEFILVDDGSSDGSLNIIKELREKDNRIYYITFSRNFGKESAILAGLEYSSGDYVTLMDADLQDPPEYLSQMYDGIINEGFDCVALRRRDRKGEPVIRSFFARCFYKFINKISKTEIMDGARDFRLMTRQMVDEILKVCEYNRFSKGIFGWVGFKTKWLTYTGAERAAGKTSWSFWGLLIYSIEGIVAFSTAPLAISSFMGVFFCVLSFIAMMFFFIKTLLFGDPISGYPSTICILLFVSGIQLFTIGILGQYVSKTYLETKKRPHYILREKITSDDDE